MTWQPIETAPKDHGHEFLGWNERDGVTVFRVYSMMGVGPFHYAKHDIESDAYSPTHWMQLPEPPK